MIVGKIKSSRYFSQEKYSLPTKTISGAAHYSEGSLFRTHKFRIPGGSLIRKWNKVR